MKDIIQYEFKNKYISSTTNENVENIYKYDINNNDQCGDCLYEILMKYFTSNIQNADKEYLRERLEHYIKKCNIK